MSHYTIHLSAIYVGAFNENKPLEGMAFADFAVAYIALHGKQKSGYKTNLVVPVDWLDMPYFSYISHACERITVSETGKVIKDL